MAVKEHDLYEHQLAELARVLIDIESGKCEPYVGAVVVVYRKYWVKGHQYSGQAALQHVSCKFKPYVYRLDGMRLRTVWTKRETFHSGYSARVFALAEVKKVGGVMMTEEIRWSLHNMPLSVMAAGLNAINIHGPSF